MTRAPCGPVDPVRRVLAAEARIFEALAAQLEALAAATPRHLHDRKWLKAAARKDCCAAELVRALADKERALRDDGRGGKQGGPDGGAPAGSPAFEGEGFAPFQSVIERHDAKKEVLQAWRSKFNRIADRLAAFVKRYLEEEYARRVYRQVLDGQAGAPDPRTLPHACNYSVERLAEVLGHPQGGAEAGPEVFDPWTGRWQGRWTWNRRRVPADRPGGPNPSDQHHVWDRTRQVGDAHVQPVTQSTDGPVDGDGLDEAVREERVDLAINVWDEDCGVTGWVSKRQGGGVSEHPHIGFRVAPGVLLWISQNHNEACELLDPRDSSYFVFFEWVDERGRYGILGRRFKPVGPDARPRDVRPLNRRDFGYDSGEQHGGVYRRPD